MVTPVDREVVVNKLTSALRGQKGTPVMKRPIRGLMVAMTLILGSMVSSPAPASASHEFYHGYWPSTSHPGVANSFYSLPDDVIMDAAYFWQDNGFTNGYTPPLPAGSWDDCGGHSGWINVCAVDPSDSGLQGKVGRTTVLTNNLAIEWSRIFIANNQSNASRQRILRHEFGHAIGLGHNTEQNDDCANPPSWATTSVMRCDNPTPYIDQHDLDALSYMY